jgi:hypothetical protein
MAQSTPAPGLFPAQRPDLLGSVAIGAIELFSGDPNILLPGTYWAQANGQTISYGKFPKYDIIARKSFNPVIGTQLGALTTTVQGAGWNGTVFCVSQQGASKFSTSPDGSTWTARTGQGSLQMGPIVVVGTTFVCGTRQAAITANNIQTSSDGTTWASRHDSATDQDYYFSAATDGTAVALCGYAQATGKGSIVESSTATGTYTKRADVGSGGSIIFYCIAYGNGLWVAVSANGVIYTSSNRTSWTARTSGTTANLYAVVYHAPSALWIAYGVGVALSSPDGITWTPRAPGYTSSGYLGSATTSGVAIVDSTGRFLAGGVDVSGGPTKIWCGGESKNSPWSLRQLTTVGLASSGVSQGAYGNGRFIAGWDGGSGVMVLSEAITGATTYNLPNITSPGAGAAYWVRMA